jgi:polyferredoxin
MNENILERLVRIEDRIEAVYKSAETTRKYIKWTGIITALLFILPLLGLLFVVPSFLGNYTKSINDVTGGL